MTRKVMYCRISTSDKEQTVQTQIHEIQQKFGEVGLYFSDEGVSGSTDPMQREGFSHMMKLLKAGDSICIARNDRLSRDTVDTLELFAELSRRGIQVLSVNDETYDINDPDGEFMITLKASLAKREKALLIKRINAGIARAKAEGKHCGRTASPVNATAQKLLQDGVDVLTICQETGLSRATVYRLKKELA